MKKIFRWSLLMLIALTAVTSCKKDETLHADLSALDSEKIINTPLDDWLDANYLKPYNIQIKYRWDPYEADLDKDLVPPKENLVQPTMEAVRDIWIRPYEKTGGQYFMVYNTPKQFYLVGSPSYNNDGTITLGTAEGGRKIVLYVINGFAKSNISNLSEMMHVIHHEYTHILNQKIPYAPAFELVTKADYTANWNIPNLATARSLGFITQYSRSTPIEDFAEMTSMMLTMSKPKFDFIANNLPTDPQTKLRKKEQYVVDYFKTAWSIDYYALQTEVANAINTTTGASPTLTASLGTGKTYTSFTSVPLSEVQSTEFLGLWNTAKGLIGAQATPYILTQYQLLFGAGNLVTVRFFFTNALGTTTYNGDVDYTFTTDPTTGFSKFTLVSPQPAGTTYSNYGVVKTSLTGVTNYIQNNLFRVTYPTKAIYGMAANVGYFYKSTDANSYLIGTLNY
jgi:substrate import-associated zinc metallohydrolase lipoprotein